MRGDHIHTNKLGSLLNRLRRDFTDVSDELDSQLPNLAASVAATHVARDHPPLSGVKRLMHCEREGQRGRRWLIADAIRHVQKNSVPFDLDEPERWDSVDHRFEQTGGYVLRVGQVQSVQLHELRVAHDVRKDEKGLLSRHDSLESTLLPAYQLISEPS